MPPVEKVCADAGALGEHPAVAKPGPRNIGGLGVRKLGDLCGPANTTVGVSCSKTCAKRRLGIAGARNFKLSLICCDLPA